MKGGIRARNRSGSFSGTWWGTRWIMSLESFQISARLSRGRSYARHGQVAHLEITNGEVNARVQGSRRDAYRVRIALAQWSPQQWAALRDALRRQPMLLARLLANEMPPELDPVFSKLGLSLFPERPAEFRTECSCPDWSNPCKHIAAVHYLLAEALDDDPFLLFRMRGMDRADLLEGLAAAPPAPEPAPEPPPEPAAKHATVRKRIIGRHPAGKPTAGVQSLGKHAAGEQTAAEQAAAEQAAAEQAAGQDPPAAAVTTEVAADLDEPLPHDAEAFWRPPTLPPAAPFPERPKLNAVLPLRLGPLPFWRAEQPFLEAMAAIYAAASDLAVACVVDETVSEETDSDAPIDDQE